MDTDETLSLDEALTQAAEDQTPPRVLCGVETVLRALEPDDAAALERHMVKSKLHATNIAGILQGRGFSIKAEAIRRHRRMLRGDGEGCACRPMR